MPALCEAAFMSWRSLDRAFKERFGIGPKRYLMYYRLAQLRRQLKNAPPDSRVSKIANEWGFWHMGQLASDYKKLFEELPSETLRK
jgi:transcriptional regulator GlxA family with amidase domain